MDRDFEEWSKNYHGTSDETEIRYCLSDASGTEITAVIGTTVYKIADDFLSMFCEEKFKDASITWTSKSKVQKWLDEQVSGQNCVTQQNPVQNSSNVVWSRPWIHNNVRNFDSFILNGMKICVNSFISVMSEEGNHYPAYLERMYEDKGIKKLRVRRFDRKKVNDKCLIQSREIICRSKHEVITAESVVGFATVLALEHFSKYFTSHFAMITDEYAYYCGTKEDLDEDVEFDVKTLDGYYRQLVLSCLDLNVHALPKDLTADYNHDNRVKNKEGHKCYFGELQPNIKIELFHEDHTVNGCWFECTVFDVSKGKITVLYDHIVDRYGFPKLKDGITMRMADPDILDMRDESRLTVRPRPPVEDLGDELIFEVGMAIDAWRRNGWWEGVVINLKESEDDDLFVYLTGEDCSYIVPKKHLRRSRDWVRQEWVEVKSKPGVLSLISHLECTKKFPVTSPSVPNVDDMWNPRKRTRWVQMAAEGGEKPVTTSPALEKK